jgi:DNA-binding NarL/FixJ family response regulator
MATILVHGADLILFSRIDTQLAARGHDVRRLRSLDGAPQADVAICDAEQVDLDEAVRRLRPARLLAFGSHESPEALRRAKDAGFDRVVARSALVDRLPGMVDALLGPAITMPPTADTEGPTTEGQT